VTSEPSVLAERRDQVAWLTLNRPARLNAYDAEMLESLIVELEATHDTAAVVLTGAGRAFCSGGYLGNLASPDENLLKRMFRRSLEAVEAIRRHPRPVIAAVNGAAIGGGNELVIACDLAIAADTAVLGQSGTRVGSAPIMGATNLLTVVVGEKRAKEMSFLSRTYSALEAQEMGLVNKVVPESHLELEISRWTDEIISLSPRYLEIAKISSNLWWNFAHDSFLSGFGMLSQAIGSEDMLEGARAFLERRAPNFRREEA
jgi:enoyl-CoA hydratase/carnithine racemase